MELPLDGTGLRVLGHCAAHPSDGLAHEGGSLVLIGPAEPAFWPLFAQSPEMQDGQDDPLDRWSKRIVGAIAANVGGAAYFPSDGPPFLPFYTWALRSGQVWASPIGFLVHEDAGLWVSFRAAIWLPAPAPVIAAVQPCQTCAAPCTSACPVDAFADGYDAAACKAHINGPDTADCVARGCAARRACPVGQDRRLPAQARFHMESFR